MNTVERFKRAARASLDTASLFTSRHMLTFFSSKLRLICKMFRVAEPDLRIFYDEDSEITAGASLSNIIMNAGNDMFSGADDIRLLKIAGALLHELGHILFTNYTAWEVWESSIKQGFYWPSAPEVTPEYEDAKERVLAIGSDRRLGTAFRYVAHNLSNCLEDGRIENFILKFVRNARFMTKGLVRLRQEIYAECPTFEELVAKVDAGKMRPTAAALQLVIHYARFGEIKGNPDPNHPLGKLIEKLIPDIDVYLNAKEAVVYYDAFNRMLVLLEKTIEDDFHQMEEKMKQALSQAQGPQGQDQSQQQSSSSSQSSQGSGSGNASASSESESNSSDGQTSESENSSSDGQTSESENSSSDGQTSESENSSSDGQTSESENSSSDGQTSEDGSSSSDEGQTSEDGSNTDPSSGAEESGSDAGSDTADGKNSKSPSQTSDSNSDAESSSSSGNDSGITDEEASSTLGQMIADALGKLIGQTSDNSERMAGQAQAKGSDRGSVNRGLTGLSDTAGGKVNTPNAAEAAEGNGNISHEITSLSSPDPGITLEDIARKIADEEAEKMLSQTLQKEYSAIADEVKDFNAIHKNADVTVFHFTEVSPEEIRGYNEIARAIRPLVTRAVKSSNFYEKDREPEVRNRLYSGRLSSRHVSRQDGRLFRKTKFYEDPPQVALAVRVDCSGSMSGERIIAAQRCCIFLYEYALAMEKKYNVRIPLYIYGDCCRRESPGVNMYVFADDKFRTPSEKYRIMRLAAGGCNRDGLPIRMAVKRLEQEYPQASKVVFNITDGQPNDGYYGGEPAFEDLRDITKHCERHKIALASCAIGEDRHVIEKIYGSNHFLNISDLDELPLRMIRILKKLLK